MTSFRCNNHDRFELMLFIILLAAWIGGIVMIGVVNGW